MSSKESHTDSPPTKIAIDFGGVLSKKDGSELDHKMKGHKNTQIDMPGGLTALKNLHASGYELYLVSFCGKSRAIETKEALEKNAPGLFKEMYFTKDKPSKADICLHLGCHMMIDDSEDIIDEIKKRVPGISLHLFKGDEKEWDTIVEFIKSTTFTKMTPQPLDEKKMKKICYLLNQPAESTEQKAPKTQKAQKAPKVQKAKKDSKTPEAPKS